MPIQISLDKQPVFSRFDHAPLNYTGPNVWYFEYPMNFPESSIKATNNTRSSLEGLVRCSFCVSYSWIYIRVHDLTPGVGETIIQGISDELFKCWVSPVPARSLAVYTTTLTQGGYIWANHSNRLHRDIDTIYIDPIIKNQLVEGLRKFMASSDLYDKYGVTWKRVHLFHGVPGSGKSSTVIALASIFGKNIAKLTLTPSLNSQQVEGLFRSVPADTFLLIEDVDCLFVERTSNTSIDFSTLLNCMDGITTVRGLVLFMTTNHITKLDQAFVRPGRIDISVEFTLPGIEQLRGALKVLGSAYAHEHEEFLSKNKDISIAELQKKLFETIMNEKKSIL